MVTRLSPIESMGNLDFESQRNSEGVLTGQQVVAAEMPAAL